MKKPAGGSREQYLDDLGPKSRFSGFLPPPPPFSLVGGPKKAIHCRVRGRIGASGLRFLIVEVGRTFERRKSGFTNSVVHSIKVH